MRTALFKVHCWLQVPNATKTFLRGHSHAVHRHQHNELITGTIWSRHTLSNSSRNKHGQVPYLLERHLHRSMVLRFDHTEKSSSGQSSQNPLNMVKSKSGNALKELKETMGKQKRPKTFSFFSVSSLNLTPPAFFLYGIGGLIPFMSVPVYMHYTSLYYPTLASAQLAYGACILSFLGGVSWGNKLNFRTANLKSLSYSIFLPLLAWSGLLLYPSNASFPILMTGIAYAGYTDICNHEYPLWFRNLRFFLTILVFFSLFFTYKYSFTNKHANLFLKKNKDAKPEGNKE